MSPNTRQTTLRFRATKNTLDWKIVKNVPDEDDVKRTPRTRRNGASLQELTPSSAIATLSINSPLFQIKVEKEIEPSMPCRENEIRELQKFLSGNLSSKTPSSMYISGLPGTGKTAALTHVLENQKVSRIIKNYLDN